MRAIPRTGQLANYSAFGFDSTNHFVVRVRAVSGTKKSPELSVEKFLRNRSVFSNKESEMDESLKKQSHLKKSRHAEKVADYSKRQYFRSI